MDFRADESGYTANVQYEVVPGFQPSIKSQTSGYSFGLPPPEPAGLGTGVGGASIGQLPLAIHGSPPEPATALSVEQIPYIQGAHSIMPF